MLRNFIQVEEAEPFPSRRNSISKSLEIDINANKVYLWSTWGTEPCFWGTWRNDVGGAMDNFKELFDCQSDKVNFDVEKAIEGYLVLHWTHMY